jgi:hypothetical protein
MFFDPVSKAPISLLELGLYAKSGRMAVCCPEGYWRRGNVQVICQRFGVKLVGTMEELIREVVEMLGLKEGKGEGEGEESGSEGVAWIEGEGRGFLFCFFGFMEAPCAEECVWELCSFPLFCTGLIWEVVDENGYYEG